MVALDAVVSELDYPMFIVTAAAGRRRAGCLVGFASQGSIDPFRFMVWLSKKNYTYRVASAAEVLAVHVPTSLERDLAVLFGSYSGFSVDKFSRCGWRAGPHGVPLLTGCAQWFVGRVLDRFDTGDHEGHLLEPIAVSEHSGLGQLNFREVRDLDPGNEA